MAFSGPFLIYGAERSYFTRKVEAIFRAMAVPHEFRLKTLDNTAWLEARAGTHLIPVVLTPEDWMLWDSTPIAFFLQQRHPPRAIVPATPVQRMACLLIEDWVDEWLPRAAVHSRWCYPENAEEIALGLGTNSIGRWTGEPLDDEERARAHQVATFVRDRFGARVTRSLGAEADQAETIRTGFDHLLDVLAAHLATQPYLLGERISLADLAFVGAFVSHFVGDPEPRRWVAERQPGLIDWVEATWSAAVEGSWPQGDELAPTLTPLLEEVGREFHPYLAAHRRAMVAGEKRFELDLGSGPVEFTVVPYREASRQFVRDELSALDDVGRARVEDVLGPLGLLEIYLAEPVPGFHHQSPMGSRHPE